MVTTQVRRTEFDGSALCPNRFRVVEPFSVTPPTAPTPCGQTRSVSSSFTPRAAADTESNQTSVVLIIVPW